MVGFLAKTASRGCCTIDRNHNENGRHFLDLTALGPYGKSTPAVNSYTIARGYIGPDQGPQ
ncbi:MAG: hypothetical protein ACI9I4_002066 [Neolewinella sp.]